MTPTKETKNHTLHPPKKNDQKPHKTNKPGSNNKGKMNLSDFWFYWARRPQREDERKQKRNEKTVKILLAMKVAVGSIRVSARGMVPKRISTSLALFHSVDAAIQGLKEY